MKEKLTMKITFEEFKNCILAELNINNRKIAHTRVEYFQELVEAMINKSMGHDGRVYRYKTDSRLSMAYCYYTLIIFRENSPGFAYKFRYNNADVGTIHEALYQVYVGLQTYVDGYFDYFWEVNAR